MVAGRSASQRRPSRPSSSVPMSHLMPDTPATPDSKPLSAFPSVLKSFSRPARSNGLASGPAVISNPLTNAALAAHLPGTDVSDAQAQSFGWPEECQILLRNVRASQPLPDRIAAARGLRQAVDDFSLGSVTLIWSAAKDLVDPGLTSEARRAGFDLLSACVKEPTLSPLERRHFFEAVASHPCHPEDLGYQLNVLVDLTKHGKDVSAFESVLLPLVSKMLDDWFNNARSARKKAKDKRAKAPGGTVEDNLLQDLFTFVKELVRFSFVTFQPLELSILIDQVLWISKSTTAESDIRNSVEIIDMLVTYGEVPPAKHGPILEVLCGTYAFIDNLKDLTWKVIGNLCRSHLASNTVAILLSFIETCNESPPPRNTHCVRGAFLIIDGLMKARGAGGLFSVTFSVWMDAIGKALEAENGRFDLDVLHLVADFLQDKELLGETLQEEDLSRLFDALSICSRNIPDIDRGVPIDKRIDEALQISETKKDKDATVTLLLELSQVFEALESHYPLSPVLQPSIIRYYFSVRGILPDSSAALLLQHYREQQLCHPSNEDWSENLMIFVTSFLDDHDRQTSLRLQTLSLAHDVFKSASTHLSPENVKSTFVAVIKKMQKETDPDVLEAFVAVAVEVASHPHDEIFSMAMNCFEDSCRAFKDQTSASRNSSSSQTDVPGSTGPAFHKPGVAARQSLITAGVVRIFLRSMNQMAPRAIRAYDLLLEVARSQSSASTEARLTALKLLFRLRADWAFAIKVVPSADVETLASCLGRTVSMLDKQNIDRRSVENVTSPESTEPPQPNRRKSNQHLYRQMNMSKIDNRAAPLPKKPEPPLWIHPDQRALPEEPPSKVSEVLVSSVAAIAPSQAAETVEGAQGVDVASAPAPEKISRKIILNVKMFLELSISNIREHNHWEVYSYTIVHLQNQLANHSLFAECVPQLQMLRSVICDHIRASNFHDQNAARHSKKADVAVCLYHLLAGLVSYYALFSKNEQDDLVRTFVHGIGLWEGTAKICIHALTISCHEIPLSVSKSLNNIIQKMSSMVTQSQVAIHVLEFLISLSRAPDTYSNLRDDDYRFIFGVSTNYLQNVRDQRMKAEVEMARQGFISGSQQGTARNPMPVEKAQSSPNAAKDLPQYVYALAYHVVTFWFLSLKLADRAKHVGWLTKNLVWTDQNGQEIIDEQAQVTIDLMQRVTYSDLDETLPDSRFLESADESIVKKSWIVGLSILTVETAVATGESQLTRRLPSATTYSMHKSTMAPRPSHQIPMSASPSTDIQDKELRAAVLPAHILLQLNGSAAPTPEPLRPIALPDDDMAKRAISTFDRISTVDGHRIGVIYIDEGQSTEQEILANVEGSLDYNEFLAKIGTLVRLKGAGFNTQGLDREWDTDGEWAICWRDRVTEIVFHVTTLMPTNPERDPDCHLKKRHTGNDYVNIIFNNSGGPFNFDTFPSQFNYVNIVITPEASASHTANRDLGKPDMSDVFYTVHVMSKPGFPEISSASDPKVVSGKSLPAFVRDLALNASVFSGVWANRGHGDENVSSWRSRLRQIVTLREKYGTGRPTSSSVFPTPPGTANTTSSNNSSNTGGMMGQFHGARDTLVQRESLNLNLRRTSAAAYLSDALGGSGGGTNSSARSSVATTNTSSDTEAGGRYEESLIEGYDFSKWT
ncbi:MAG: putative ATP-dependent RNA helicase DHR1 [Chaenotheca gracillima]|nr:MAG: putative ATP-dependent RNA helicase DHR1 [Chaenotheca gracillima]